MTALAPLAPKLARLIPRLASNHDGEVVATVRAIKRTLASAGLDLHDLATALEREPETRIVYRDRPAPKRTPQMPWHEMALWCLDHGEGRLSARENDFIENVLARLSLYQWSSPTERQAAWLRSIYTRLRKGFDQ